MARFEDGFNRYRRSEEVYAIKYLGDENWDMLRRALDVWVASYTHDGDKLWIYYDDGFKRVWIGDYLIHRSGSTFEVVRQADFEAHYVECKG